MRVRLKQIVIVTFDILLAVYLVMAFVSFNRPDETKNVCRQVNIGMEENGENGFIDAQEIKRRLQEDGLYPVGKPLRQVDARKIEEKLKMSPFVKTAECYKTQNGKVYINITQLLPVIRIKADNGDDYYVDDKNSIMPNSSYTSDLIIATGHITRTFATNYMSPLGKALMSNDLWKNIVEQVHVLPDNGIEIVPRVGEHVVHLGRLPEIANVQEREKAISEYVDRKLTRLEKFYKYGLPHAGWNRYFYIDIQFDNQIICRKKHVKAGHISDKAEKTGSSAQVQATGSQRQQLRDSAKNKQQKVRKEKIS